MDCSQMGESILCQEMRESFNVMSKLSNANIEFGGDEGLAGTKDEADALRGARDGTSTQVLVHYYSRQRR